jgi:hypothetical protein
MSITIKDLATTTSRSTAAGDGATGDSGENKDG